MKVLCVCGARPNFMKIAAVLRAFETRPQLQSFLVHTGQHYDATLDRCFFDELDIPRPDMNLDVGSHSHAVQTAVIMQRFEPVLLRQRPAAVLVVGDVNSTLACALVAAKLHVPVFHVEAGLRSFDRSMPEEINRVLTDALSDLLFVSEPAGVANLRREGSDPQRIHLVGNVMIDTLRAHARRAARCEILARLGLRPREFVVLTLHRPANVDEADTFAGICTALERIQESRTVVFPVHPRTRARLEQNGQHARLSKLAGVRLIEPLGYRDFLKLMTEAAIVLTDSGGIQEETTVLGVPCLTLRENTERPITIEQGTNRLVGSDSGRILEGYHAALAAPREPRAPALWDGRAAERIADIVLTWAAGSVHHGNRPGRRVPISTCVP